MYSSNWQDLNLAIYRQQSIRVCVCVANNFWLHDILTQLWIFIMLWNYTVHVHVCVLCMHMYMCMYVYMYSISYVFTVYIQYIYIVYIVSSVSFKNFTRTKERVSLYDSCSCKEEEEHQEESCVLVWRWS